MCTTSTIWIFHSNYSRGIGTTHLISPFESPCWATNLTTSHPNIYGILELEAVHHTDIRLWCGLTSLDEQMRQGLQQDWSIVWHSRSITSDRKWMWTPYSFKFREFNLFWDYLGLSGSLLSLDILFQRIKMSEMSIRNIDAMESWKILFMWILLSASLATSQGNIHVHDISPGSYRYTCTGSPSI